jgi:hypothetical protein
MPLVIYYHLARPADSTIYPRLPRYTEARREVLYLGVELYTAPVFCSNMVLETAAFCLPSLISVPPFMDPQLFAWKFIGLIKSKLHDGMQILNG